MTPVEQQLAALNNNIAAAFHKVDNQLLRVRQDVAGVRAMFQLAAAEKTPRFPVEFVSQYGEDLLAYQLLGQPLQGFFIEVGAFDGYRYSVTYGLEAIGWNGLLIEAIPEQAEKCRARRPNSRVVHSALGARGASGTATFTVVADQYGGMLSYQHADPQHIADTSWASRSTISVPITSMDELLRDHNGPIDLASIDVEGAELNVLDGFDLDRFKPRLLLIEDNSRGKNPALVNQMSKFGYKLGSRLVVNDIYFREDDAELQERLKWLKMR